MQEWILIKRILAATALALIIFLEFTQVAAGMAVYGLSEIGWVIIPLANFVAVVLAARWYFLRRYQRFWPTLLRIFAIMWITESLTWLVSMRVWLIAAYGPGHGRQVDGELLAIIAHSSTINVVLFGPLLTFGLTTFWGTNAQELAEE